MSRQVFRCGVEVLEGGDHLFAEEADGAHQVLFGEVAHVELAAHDVKEAGGRGVVQLFSDGFWGADEHESVLVEVVEVVPLEAGFLGFVEALGDVLGACLVVLHLVTGSYTHGPAVDGAHAVEQVGGGGFGCLLVGLVDVDEGDISDVGVVGVVVLAPHLKVVLDGGGGLLAAAEEDVAGVGPLAGSGLQLFRRHGEEPDGRVGLLEGFHRKGDVVVLVVGAFEGEGPVTAGEGFAQEVHGLGGDGVALVPVAAVDTELFRVLRQW